MLLMLRVESIEPWAYAPDLILPSGTTRMTDYWSTNLLELMRSYHTAH